jgi:hypothetical protein
MNQESFQGSAESASMASRLVQDIEFFENKRRKYSSYLFRTLFGICERYQQGQCPSGNAQEALDGYFSHF